jgi:capsular exopolysaccharide synthesis family protein
LNLAISFAENGQKVLLIDADMRRPAMARLLVEKVAPGLSNVLAGLVTEEEAIRKEVYPNLDILFSGDIPPNPSELLGSQRMRDLLDRLSEKYDYILVDTPPVNVVTDTCVVANLLHGVLYLVRKDKADRDSVTKGVNQLKLTGARLLGFVVNGADASVDKRYVSEYK